MLQLIVYIYTIIDKEPRTKILLNEKSNRIFSVAAMTFTTNNASAQVVGEGNVLVDVYYGFPNFYTSIFRGIYAENIDDIPSSDLKIGGIGPLGIRAEYMVADKIGVGIDVAYSNSTINYTEFDYADNRDYDYNLSTSKIGVMATFNFHFIEHEKLDFYGVAGAGYKNRTFKFDSTDPDPEYASESGSVTFIPVAAKIGVGIRYFFTQNIGVNLAVGVGQGSAINGGLAIKF